MSFNKSLDKKESFRRMTMTMTMTMIKGKNLGKKSEVDYFIKIVSISKKISF